jgi:hypothetical protein
MDEKRQKLDELWEKAHALARQNKMEQASDLMHIRTLYLFAENLGDFKVILEENKKYKNKYKLKKVM